jgi:SAM-dependent methyltransferase
MRLSQEIVRKVRGALSLLTFKFRQETRFGRRITRINLCSGSRSIPGYFNIDISKGADLVIDLAKRDLPFPPNSLDSIVCISGINYFSRARTVELINQCYTILTPGGIARFGVQDMEKLAQLYLKKDTDFFFQKLPDGKDRFEGSTIGDKFVAWFYGYVSGGYACQYFYDFDSLSFIFKQAGFRSVERKTYRESGIDDIELIDNRPDQMFFLEAVK